MKKINLLFQEFLKLLLVFMLCFIWLRYFLRKLWLAVTISAFLSLAICLVWFLLKQKRQISAGLKLKEKEDAQNMFLSLACSERPMHFFKNLARKKHQNLTVRKEYIVINHVEEKVKTLLYADLSFSPLTTGRFVEIYNKIKKEKANKIVIVCHQVDQSVPTFCQNFKEKFLLLDEFAAYEKLYKYYNFFPEITHKYSTEKKKVFKDFLAYSFNKKRTKAYFFSAFVLLLSSVFVRATIYYCVIASILIVFAFVSQFNPRFNVRENPEIL